MSKKLLGILFCCILLIVAWALYRNGNSNTDEVLNHVPHSPKSMGSSSSDQSQHALPIEASTRISPTLSSFAPSEGDIEESQLFQATAANHAELLRVARFIVPSKNSQPGTRPKLSEKQATEWSQALYRDALLASYLSSDLSDLQRQKAEEWLNQPDLPLEPSLLVVGPHLSVNYLQRVKTLLGTQTSTGLESEQARQRLIPELMDMTRRRKRLSDNYMKRWLGPFLLNDAVPLTDKIALGREFRATKDWGLYRSTISYMKSRLQIKKMNEEQLTMINDFMSETKSNDK